MRSEARMLVLAPLVSVSLAPPTLAAQATPAYQDPARPVAERVEDLLGRMTLQEKFWQLYMSPGSLDDPEHDYSAGAFGLQIGMPGDAPDGLAAGERARLHAERVDRIQRWFVEESRLGVPIIPFDEALHGLTRDGATVFPQAIGLAAAWDVDLMARVAGAVAAETRSRGVRQVLSPVVNLGDDVRWGRVEESYGEDPYLSAAMGRAFVAAFERVGVVATPKHLVANVGAGGRDSYPIDLSERYLREYHLPPFDVAVREAGARSVMTAYNSVDGRPATQQPWLLNQLLKDEWGFGGFVISDAAATGGATVLHMTEPDTPVAAQHAWEAGLDVVFQSTYEQHRPYLAAVERGLVSEDILDRAVARVLRAKFELGLFENPYADPGEAARLASSAEHRSLAREAAAASVVLLENRAVLPLARNVGRVAVIGADAVEPRPGGYSAPMSEPVSILDAIRERAGAGVEVTHAPGPGRGHSSVWTVDSDALVTARGAQAEPGLRGEYWANIDLSGDPALVRADSRIDFRWTLSSPGRGIPYDWYSARWTGVLRVPPGGVTRLGVEGNDGYRLWLDGELIVDNWRKRSYGVHVAEVDLAANSMHDVRLEYFEPAGNAWLKLVWDGGADVDYDARVAEARRAAERSDLAIVVAGLVEGEFQDRSSLALPGLQEELILAVASLGKPTVVVVVGGSAFTLDAWLDEVDAVLMAWYPGVEGGRGVADVLFGDADPGGRLPITFPVREGQLPLVYNHKPTGRGDDYVDGTGQPAFPFGYGLSYTDFEYGNLEIDPGETTPGAPVRVRATVRNVGDREGTDVVQLYIRDVLASVARPVIQLAGFEKVRLRPGESRTVEFVLGERELRMLDADLHWTVEPGTFRVMVGRSSKDIRLRGHLEVLGGMR